MSPYEKEFEWIRDSRKARLGSTPTGPAQNNLIGLAFSGGGIRSATFNLGVLQGLAKSKLLHKIDYLSSVSGGGYISSWLLGWMHHRSLGAREVEQQLKAEQATLTAVSEVPEIRFLRNFSNYLTPRKGLFSGDFWAFVAVYFRNTLLNLLILICALLAAVFVPRVVVWLFHAMEMIEGGVRTLRQVDNVPWYLTSQFIALYFGILSGAIAVVVIGLNMAWLEPDPHSIDAKSYERFSSPRRVQFLIVLPLVLASACLSYSFLWFFEDIYLSAEFWWRAMLLGMVLYVLQWGLAGVFREFERWRQIRKGKISPRGGPILWKIVLCAAISGLLAGLLLIPYGYILHHGGIPESDPQHNLQHSLWFVITFGPPALIGIMLITGVLHIGLLGRAMSDDHREWVDYFRGSEQCRRRAQSQKSFYV